VVTGVGYTDRFLGEDETLAIVAAGLGRLGLDGKRVIVIIPDSTRSGPVPLLFRGLTDILQGRVAKLDFLVALGTHIPMDDAHIQRHVGITAEERRTRYADIGFYNHNWQQGLRHIGTIPASEISTLSNGLMAEDVRVEVNARLFDYDQIIICGPVFPHEVAGFSGGNKYFFPGVSGADIINFTHWMAAVITNLETIGVPNAPVRRVIDRAAAMIDLPKSCFSMVVKGHDDLAGLYFGTPEESQAAAAELSSKVDIVYLERPVKTVLSVMPTLYDDIWTAGKGMYKMEPVVADGGTVIIYAPQIDEVSYTHGAVLDRIGYHVRDYFLAQMGRFADEPLMVMAHATQVKGMGAYTDGVEEPRIDVVLATGVPKERCDRINLGYMDPASIRVEEWMGREDEGILVVPRSGELLHRLRA
jgi:lactate racemase